MTSRLVDPPPPPSRPMGGGSTRRSERAAEFPLLTEKCSQSMCESFQDARRQAAVRDF